MIEHASIFTAHTKTYVFFLYSLFFLDFESLCDYVTPVMSCNENFTTNNIIHHENTL